MGNTRVRATAALRLMVASAEGHEDQRLSALYSGNIGGTGRARRDSGVKIRNPFDEKMDSFAVYIQERGEGAAVVSEALVR